MSDETKIGLGAIFVVVCLIVAISIGCYCSAENVYREKALAASTEIAKARLATEPVRAQNERLDAILGRLDRIERAIAIKEKP